MAAVASLPSEPTLRSLLVAPSVAGAQQQAIAQLAQQLGTATSAPAKLNSSLELLLAQARASAVSSEALAQSTRSVDALLEATRAKLAAVHASAAELRAKHDKLEDRLIDHHELLVSSLSQRERQSGDEGTLRERLDGLSSRRKELKLASEWFDILAKTEQLGIDTLRAINNSQLQDAFSNYTKLVEFITKIHEAAPTLALSGHLVAMASSVWTAVVKILSTRLLEKLEKIGWPTPFKDALDWDQPGSIEFKIAFLDLLALEQLQATNPLPGQAEVELAVRPVLAIVPLVHPLLLRFRWHFDGDRNTNRIDKPEYPLSHVLNLLPSHERFLSEDIQPLLDSYGFTDVDAVNEFTSQLLPPLASRLRHHIPQLLEMPPVLAHTIYQTLEFDGMLRSREYAPRGAVSLDEFEGLSEVILGEPAWFNRWLEGEREFFDTKYYALISAADAWHILSPEDYESPDGRNSVRPTQSSLRVAELLQQLADRYRPLPKDHTLPFLLTLHLPLLNSYSGRIGSALDAFESLAFGILPGALSQTGAATAGLGGMLRLVRAGVSARWMTDKCSEWGEDAFFLGLYEFLSEAETTPELQQPARDLLAESDGTVFDKERKAFEKLADRAEELIVRHVVRETLAEMKAYLAKRWDFPPPTAEPEDGAEGEPEAAPVEAELELSPLLMSSLSLFSSLLSTLTASLPPTVATSIYRRISTSLSTSLYDRLLINRAWSESGALQLAYDLEHGFLQAARDAKIPRGVGRGWELLKGATTVLALPAGEVETGEISFAKVMRMAWDDVAPEGEGTEWGRVMEDLGVGEVVGKAQVRQTMRRRPECWR